MSRATRRRQREPETPPEYLRRMGITPRRALGQHFLVDELLLGRIADACDLDASSTVLEVGAGPGGLTEELAQRAGCVVAVELDEELAALARGRLAGLDGVCVLAADILGHQPAELLAECGASPPYALVGNLPYYLTQPIVRRALEAAQPPERLVVMVQREVARRLVAGPGKESLFSLSVRVYGVPELLFDVPASAFWPAPKVRSSVVRIERFERPAVDLAPEQRARFFVLLRAGFSEPRKQLHNVLRGALGLSREQTQALLAAAGVDPERRAQHLDLDDWQRLHHEVEARHPESLDVG